jgi:hypothetical protein
MTKFFACWAEVLPRRKLDEEAIAAFRRRFSSSQPKKEITWTWERCYWSKGVHRGMELANRTVECISHSGNALALRDRLNLRRNASPTGNHLFPRDTADRNDTEVLRRLAKAQAAAG